MSSGPHVVVGEHQRGTDRVSMNKVVCGSLSIVIVSFKVERLFLAINYVIIYNIDN